MAKVRLEELALHMLTRVGFLHHRVGVNPENFLLVLQKTQLRKSHKQAIMQVVALPGSASVPAHGWEGLQHPFPAASGRPDLSSTEGVLL